MASHAYDIIVLADWRRQFEPAWYLSNLLEAQTAAGYRTGIIQVDGPAGDPLQGFSAPLRRLIDRGQVDWLDPDRPVAATLAVAVDPLTFARPADRRPQVSCERSVLLCDRQVLNASDQPRFDLEQIRDNVHELFHQRSLWIASTCLIRAELAALADLVPLDENEWTPVLNVDEVRVDRPWPRSNSPVLGTFVTEPNSSLSAETDLRQVLPNDPHIEVRLFGRPASLRAAVRPWPKAWHIDDCGKAAPGAFLCELDFYLERHLAGREEPLALGTLLAAAAGVISLAPPRLQPYLGPLALPVEPKYARWRIMALQNDAAAITAQRQEAVTALQGRHGWGAHQQRLKAMIGPPRPSIGLVWRGRRRHPQRVLFVSTNGVGMGHLTRQLAIARRLPPSIESVFLTMSQAFGLLREFGFLAEYTPYHGNYGGNVPHWNRHLARLLNEMIAFYDPQAVVFDGNYPFGGIVGTRKQHPGRRFVWCRRALWRPNQDPEALRRSAAFDLVLEPGELATRLDRGSTRQHQANVRLMPPIRLLDKEELWPRPAAADELGLNSEKPAVLLQLGSRNNFDFQPLLDRLLPALHRVPQLQIVAIEWLISERAGGWPDYVKSIQCYPVSRYVRAFDFVIATPGYNTFHELAAFAVPAVFVSNENPRMDDQVTRAAFAERHGFGLSLRRSELYKIDALIARMTDESARAEMRRAAVRLATPNGAENAADAVCELTFAIRTFDQAWLHGIHRRPGL